MVEFDDDDKRGQKGKTRPKGEKRRPKGAKRGKEAKRQKRGRKRTKGEKEAEKGQWGKKRLTEDKRCALVQRSIASFSHFCGF